MNELGGERAPLLTTPPPVTSVTGARAPRAHRPENFRQAHVLPKMIGRFLSLKAEESVSPRRK